MRRMQMALSSTEMGLSSGPVLSKVESIASTPVIRLSSRKLMRSALCTPRSAITPIAACSLLKNHVPFPGLTLHVSGPEWPKAVRNVSGLPITPEAIISLAC